MKARMVRLNVFYEVAFSRPAFERIASFVRIIEPIYDVFCSEVSSIPSDAINLENGSTIATTGVTLALFSGHSVFEAKLDGYRAHFLDLRSLEDIKRAKRHAKLFESAVLSFLTNTTPAKSRYVTSSWLTVDGGRIAAETLVRNLTWLPESDDPFQIGATKIRSLVKFECFNNDNTWKIGITLDKSTLLDADLFLEISGEYMSGTSFDSFDKLADHLSTVSNSIIDKLNLTIEW